MVHRGNYPQADQQGCSTTPIKNIRRQSKHATRSEVKTKSVDDQSHGVWTEACLNLMCIEDPISLQSTASLDYSPPVRFNPNSYKDGKVSLSLLGTWIGKEQNERWSPSSSIKSQNSGVEYDLCSALKSIGSTFHNSLSPTWSN